MPEPKKSLGQHWLNDDASLRAICRTAQLQADDTVLEIGPGPGYLTKHLLAGGAKVVAVEIDSELISSIDTHPKLEIIKADIREFDLTTLPDDYTVVANLPYYLTNYILRLLSDSANSPLSMTLLVQKEVAERIAAGVGRQSILSLSMQLYGEVELGPVITADKFTPPPKVDSQVVRIVAHASPVVSADKASLMKLIKIGFAAKRKTLINNLSAAYPLSKSDLSEILTKLNIKASARAQELTLGDWDKLETLLQ